MISSGASESRPADRIVRVVSNVRYWATCLLKYSSQCYWCVLVLLSPDAYWCFWAQYSSFCLCSLATSLYWKGACCIGRMLMRLVPCEPVAFDEYLVQVLTILLISTGASEPRPADRIVRVVSNVRYWATCLLKYSSQCYWCVLVLLSPDAYWCFWAQYSSFCLRSLATSLYWKGACCIGRVLMSLVPCEPVAFDEYLV